MGSGCSTNQPMLSPIRRELSRTFGIDSFIVDSNNFMSKYTNIPKGSGSKYKTTNTCESQISAKETLFSQTSYDSTEEYKK